MMTHAAATGSLPYPFHSHVPLHYYPHVGVTAAAAAAAASGAAASPFATSIRPLDTFRALSHPYSRPELLCSFRHPGLYQSPAAAAAAAAGLNSSAAASTPPSNSPLPPPPAHWRDFCELEERHTKNHRCYCGVNFDANNVQIMTKIANHVL
uniref:Uncharacterized protein n=1 Tax=Varanus komodoensis TaxID=61221 RepID=A0A8D2J048_VARKO